MISRASKSAAELRRPGGGRPRDGDEVAVMANEAGSDVTADKAEAWTLDHLGGEAPVVRNRSPAAAGVFVPDAVLMYSKAGVAVGLREWQITPSSQEVG